MLSDPSIGPEAADPFQRFATLQFGRAAAAARVHRKTEVVVSGQRAAVRIQRRDHRDLEFREFLQFYPTNPRADYAQYKLAMSHFRQMRAPERDQTETRDALREFAEFRNLLPRGIKLAPEDVWEGVSFVLSVKLEEPQFSGQTKERLASRECAAFVGGVIKDHFALWLNERGRVADRGLADMQTFVLPDALEDLCSPANLRYQARSLLAQYGQKRNWHPLFCPRE